MEQLSPEYNNRLSKIAGDSHELIRVPDLDCANYLALTKINQKSGAQVYYFIDHKEVLSSIDVVDLFSKLSKRIIETGSGQEHDVKFIARLFLLICKGRKALVVDNLKDCALLEPGRIAKDQFYSPMSKNNKGTLNYKFWTYEIRKNLISKWELDIDGKGTFSYSVDEFPPPNDWE